MYTSLIYIYIYIQCIYVIQDELDAAGRVVSSRLEIRSILQEHEASHASRMFGSNTASAVASSASGTSGGVDMYEGVEKDGTAMLMNIELNQEAARAAAAAAASSSTSTNSKDKKGKGGGKSSTSKDAATTSNATTTSTNTVAKGKAKPAVKKK